MDEPLEVLDVPARNRYELRRGDEVISVADYRVDGDVVTVPHVETAPRHRGNGFAAHLVEGMLDDLRERGSTIRPICPFAIAYLRDHPDQHDLLAAGVQL